MQRFCNSYAWSCNFCEGWTSFLARYFTRNIKCAPGLLYFIWWRFSSFISRHPLRASFLTVSANIDKALSVHPSAKIFACGDFSVHHKDWLTYLGVTDRLSELCYNFSVSHDLIQGLYPGL